MPYPYASVSRYMYQPADQKNQKYVGLVPTAHNASSSCPAYRTAAR